MPGTETTSDSTGVRPSSLNLFTSRPDLLPQKPKDPRRFITLAGACLTCSSYEELQKITCPVFVIGAQEDRIVGSEASREIAEKLGCRLHLYEHMAHALWEEAGDFNKLVLDFLHSPSFP